MSRLSISVIVNTHDRAQSLRETLRSLRWQSYDPYEVVVVNGPSSDETEDVLREFDAEIKQARCPVANLARSRNIGIRLAAGDVVAFIDDDAIPEPEWLEALAESYRRSSVSGVGGMVYDDSGYTFQARYIVCDRTGGASFPDRDPSGRFDFPQSPKYCAPMGTNASFRRKALLEIGGFDEEYAYYLEETDVCVRLLDAGHRVVFNDRAYIHHKYLRNSRRSDDKVLVDRYEIMKNQVYFGFINRLDSASHADVLNAVDRHMRKHVEQVRSHYERGSITSDDVANFERDRVRALREGLARGLSGKRRLSSFQGDPPPLLQRASLQPPGGQLTICLLSQEYPPAIVGGIGRATSDLAEALARLGHIVHVLTAGGETTRVDFENGVWVHRLAVADRIEDERGHKIRLPRPPRKGPAIAAHHWRLAAVYLHELERISTHRNVDIVHAPLWDVEGIAILLSRRWPVVTSTPSSFRTVLETKPEWRSDPRFMKNVGSPWIECERFVLEHSDAILAFTEAALHNVEREHELELERERVGIVPLGLQEHVDRQPTRTADRPEREGPRPGVELLFVGRLESRKGIETLLRATPTLMEEHPELRLTLIGDDTIEARPGQTHRALFEATHADAPWLDRVSFVGKVEEPERVEHLKRCDIFIAPSTYESFGLVNLEAMMFEKPVVSCRVGGIPEVVAHGETGILIEPGDVEALAAEVSRLVSDATAREALGVAGRRRYESSFTAEHMAARTVDFFRGVLGLVSPGA